MATPKCFDVEPVGRGLVVALCDTVSGFADQLLVDEVDRLLALLKSSGAQVVIVDFERTHYFSSTLLEALLTVWRQLQSTNGRMALCNVSDVGREILDVSKFSTLWPIYPSRNEALRELKIESDSEGPQSR